MGRCVNCGFLGKRDKNATVSACYEASAVDRLTGSLTSLGVLIATRPWCFVGKAFFHAELAEIGAKEYEADKVKELIEKDRNCSSWYKWTEFISPKEHFEELKMEELEQRRRKFEFELFNMNKKITDNSNRVMIWLAVCAIIFAAAEVFFAVAVINPDHWLFGWLR